MTVCNAGYQELSLTAQLLFTPVISFLIIFGIYIRKERVKPLIGIAVICLLAYFAAALLMPEGLVYDLPDSCYTYDSERCIFPIQLSCMDEAVYDNAVTILLRNQGVSSMEITNGTVVSEAFGNQEGVCFLKKGVTLDVQESTLLNFSRESQPGACMHAMEGDQRSRYDIRINVTMNSNRTYMLQGEMLDMPEYRKNTVKDELQIMDLLILLSSVGMQLFIARRLHQKKMDAKSSQRYALYAVVVHLLLALWILASLTIYP